jgi:hypothetical protein
LAHHSIAVFIAKIFSAATQRLSGLAQGHFLELRYGEVPDLTGLLKNPSTPLPSTLQGLKNPAIAVFWTTDWSYNDFFNRLSFSTHSDEQEKK